MSVIGRGAGAKMRVLDVARVVLKHAARLVEAGVGGGATLGEKEEGGWGGGLFCAVFCVVQGAGARLLVCAACAAGEW